MTKMIHFRRTTSVGDKLEQLAAPCGAKRVSGVEDWTQVTCPACLATQPEEVKEIKMTAKKTYNVRDLSDKLNMDSKKIRVMLRSAAIEKAGKSYEWNGKEFQSVAKQVSKLISV